MNTMIEQTVVHPQSVKRPNKGVIRANERPQGFQNKNPKNTVKIKQKSTIILEDLVARWWISSAKPSLKSSSAPQ